MPSIHFLCSKYPKIIGCVLVLLAGYEARAQTNFSEYKPYLLHSRDSFMVFSEKLLNPAINSDTARGKRLIDSLVQYAAETKNDALEQNAQLLKANFSGFHTAQKLQTLQEILQVKQWAKDNNHDYLLLRAQNMQARYHYINAEYDQAFEQYLASWPMLQAMPQALMPEKKRNIQHIATAYYDFGDYRQCIYYLLQALQVGSSHYNRLDNFTILNTLGMCYRQLNMPDSSNYYFKAVSLHTGCPPVWKIIANGNLGENYVSQGVYSRATPLLLAELSATYHSGDSGLVIHAASYLAEIGFRTGNMAEASRYTRLAQQLLEGTKNVEGRLPEPFWRYHHLYSLLARLYAAEGNVPLASRYADSTTAAKDSVARQFSSLNLTRAQQKIERQQHEKTLATIKQKKVTERNIILTVAALACLAILWIYSRQRRRHRYQQLLKEVELQQARADMDNANAQLLEFARHISEKNNLLEELEAKIGDNNAEALKQLYNSSILTNEEWERFRLLFEKVHQGYLQNLRLKISNISPAEMRFMALAKLGFSNKEMAAALGVSAEAIRSVWHRLRKKLELSDDTRLEDFVQSI